MSSSNANENRASASSPMHLGITGQFSPEDIQELLGVMGDGGDQHQEEGEEGSHSIAVSQEPAEGHPRQPTTVSTYVEDGTAVAMSSASVPVPSAQTVPGAGVVNTGSAPLAPCGVVTVQGAAGEEAKAQARSERKRSREKQRRSDVNKQFADLTQLLQKIDAEDINEEDAKNGATVNRVTFNPSNRVDLIARTIVLLERLHEANKRRKTEISSLQQQLEEAKKAGEDTAAKLKEAMLAPPGQPMSKQFMMMVPMMMSADGSGGAVPMMNPYMQQMPQPFMQMPAPAMAAAATAVAQPTTVTNPQAQAPAQAAPTPTPPPATAPSPAPAVVATHPMAATHPRQQQQQPQTLPHPTQAAAFQYMMPPMAGARGFMMPVPAPMAGQPMAMMPQPMQTVAMPTRSAQENQAVRQEQKDSSSPGMNHGSNLAHCA